MWFQQKQYGFPEKLVVYVNPAFGNSFIVIVIWIVWIS